MHGEWPTDDNVAKRIEHECGFEINGLLEIMGQIDFQSTRANDCI